MTPARLLRCLLAFNALACVVAAVVLVFLPSAIPSLIGIRMEPDQSLICRLLGASELAIATACIAAVRWPSRDRTVLCIAVLVVFHAASIVACCAELFDRFDAVVMANIVVRIAIVALLVGLARTDPIRR